MAEPSAIAPRPILVLVNDLFFILKIEDTARYLGLPVVVVNGAEEYFRQLGQGRPSMVIADLTMHGLDMAALLAPLAADAEHTAVPVLGYTTHADWKRTAPLHDTCAKVVTKDTLSRSLASLIQQLRPQR